MTNETFHKSLLYRRLIQPLRHSAAGLAFAWRSEEAFRIEVLLCVLLVPLALVLEPTWQGRLWLIGSLILVLIVELLNTAIEKLVDRISLEPHELSKAAKDVGSAAVGLSLLWAVCVWIVVLL